MIEFFDFGERHIDLRHAGRASVPDHLRNPVQRLRPEDDVHVRRATHDAGAFLRGDAAAHTDHDIRVSCLQRADAAQVMKHALLRLFAYRARVEEDDVGVVGPIGQREVLFGREHVGNACRIVLVHLAAKRPNIELATHLKPAKQGRGL